MVAQNKKLHIVSICTVIKYSENESSGDQVKRDRMNMSLLNAAHADDRDKRSAGGRI